MKLLQDELYAQLYEALVGMSIHEYQRKILYNKFILHCKTVPTRKPLKLRILDNGYKFTGKLTW